MSSGSRLVWLDITRGIGLILVVLGHNVIFMEENPYWHKYIYSFHMPLFFFLTGCTISFGHATSSLRRSLSVAVPYLVMSLTLLPITLSTKPEFSVADILLGILYGSSTTIDSLPLWFLSCLAIALLFTAGVDAAFIKQHSRQRPMEKKNIALLSLLSLALIASTPVLFSLLDIQIVPRLAWGSVHRSGLFWNADIAICSVGYMIAGRLFSEYSVFFQKIKAWILLLVAAALLFLLNTLILYFDLKFDLNHRYMTPGDWVIFVPFIGIAATLCVAFALERASSWFDFLMMIGQSGIVILWLHSRLENKLFNIMALKFLADIPSWLYWVAAIAFSITVSVLVDRFIIKRSTYLRMLFYPRFKRLFGSS